MGGEEERVNSVTSEERERGGEACEGTNGEGKGTRGGG